MVELFDLLKEELAKEGWRKIGYNENGALIQWNEKTGEIRVLDEWVEIIKNTQES